MSAREKIPTGFRWRLMLFAWREIMLPHLFIRGSEERRRAEPPTSESTCALLAPSRVHQILLPHGGRTLAITEDGIPHLVLQRNSSVAPTHKSIATGSRIVGRIVDRFLVPYKVASTF